MAIVLHIIYYTIPIKHDLLQYKSAKTLYSNTGRHLMYTQACMWKHTGYETNSVKRNTH
jgi:hypothetical protein